MGNASVLGHSEPCWTCALYMGKRCTPAPQHWCEDGFRAIRDPDAGCGRWRSLDAPRVPGKRIIVCGGRNYRDHERVHAALELAHARAPVGWLVHGEASGADLIAENWARDRGILREAHPALWKDLGKAAGPIRNQQMVDTGADGCIAFPGGRGTADCTARCEAAGIPVWRPYGSGSR